MRDNRINAVLIMIVVPIFLILMFMSYLSIINSDVDLKREFRNGTILTCQDLIVSSDNWSISGEHLINSNSSGFININNCKIQED